jgi:hypothetical protein
MVDVNHERSDRLKRWNLIKIANKYITRAHLLNKEKLKWQNYDDVINVTSSLIGPSIYGSRAGLVGAAFLAYNAYNK